MFFLCSVRKQLVWTREIGYNGNIENNRRNGHEIPATPPSFGICTFAIGASRCCGGTDSHHSLYSASGQITDIR